MSAGNLAEARAQNEILRRSKPQNENAKALLKRVGTRQNAECRMWKRRYQELASAGSKMQNAECRMGNAPKDLTVPTRMQNADCSPSSYLPPRVRWNSERRMQNAECQAGAKSSDQKNWGENVDFALASHCVKRA